MLHCPHCLRVWILYISPSKPAFPSCRPGPTRVVSQRYERGFNLVTTNLPFGKWAEVFGSERLTGALLDRLTHHVHILEMNGERLQAQAEQTCD